MAEITASGQDIDLTGKSGAPYNGKIYADKGTTTNYQGQAIVCLTNSSFTEGKWQHSMNSIYLTSDTTEALAHFSIRDDISHMILISYNPSESDNTDKVDDLIRNYIHA